MQMRVLMAILTAVLLTATGGCTTFAAPRIEVSEALEVSRTEEATRLDVAMDLRNPNEDPLDLREARYTLYMDGRPVYAGRWATQVTLSGQGTRRVTLPAVVPGALPRSGAWRVEGELVYLVPSRLAEILLDTGWWEPTASFTGAGRLE